MSEEPIYIVSGYMRCGTSMMMNCLLAGGMNAAFEPKRDELNVKHGDDQYQGNPNGYYELSRAEYKHRDFPLMYRGKLLKCLMGGLNRLHVAKYKIIFMRRDPEESRQSFIGMFRPNPVQQQKMKEYYTGGEYVEDVERCVARLKNRKDVDVVEIDYRTVVENPRSVFSMLSMMGWPIDPEKASAVVDPKQCRYKAEELHGGL